MEEKFSHEQCYSCVPPSTPVVLTFFLSSGCSTLWLFKWFHWGASLPFDFNLGTCPRGQTLTILQPHSPWYILSPFGTQGLGVTWWELWLAASAPWFTLIGYFRVHLGGSGGGHDRRWAYHGLRLRFRADKEKTKISSKAALRQEESTLEANFLLKDKYKNIEESRTCVYILIFSR